MPYVLLENNIVVAHDDAPKDGHVLAPAGVGPGWQLNGETWEKSAALIAQEETEAALAIKRANVANAIANVRQWVEHAKNTVVAGWDAATTQQKMEWTKQHIDRCATIWDRLADLIEGHKLNQ